MSNIKWKIGPAKHRNGAPCEIVHILDDKLPVVKHKSGRYYVHQGNGVFDYLNETKSSWDLVPPRERVEGYLWVRKSDGEIYSAFPNQGNTCGEPAATKTTQNIPVAIERDGPESDWELVK